jgi:hypothetical protein
MQSEPRHMGRNMAAMPKPIKKLKNAANQGFSM